MGMNMKDSDIVIHVRFLQTNEGGRGAPIVTDQLSPILEHAGKYYACRLLLQDVGTILPGDIVDVPLKLLRPDLVKSLMKVGDSIKIRELGTIAEGTIKEL